MSDSYVSEHTITLFYILVILLGIAGLAAEITLIVGFGFSIGRLNYFKDNKDSISSSSSNAGSTVDNSKTY